MRTTLVVTFLATCALGCHEAQEVTVHPTSVTFGDNQVLGLAVAETDHQTKVALAALQRGLSYPEVQAYATRLSGEFADARDRLLAVGDAQHLVIDQDTRETTLVLLDTTDDVALLQPPLAGVDIDRVYMPDSVNDLERAIGEWNDILLPGASDAALQAELQATLQLLEAEAPTGMQVLRQIGLGDGTNPQEH